MNYPVRSSIHIAATTLTAAIALTIPGAASAQHGRISMPALPLDQALQRIAAETGEPLNIDPDAVKNLTSNPVTNARDADDAVRYPIACSSKN